MPEFEVTNYNAPSSIVSVDAEPADVVVEPVVEVVEPAVEVVEPVSVAEPVIVSDA